jgi:hypothetical protein
VKIIFGELWLADNGDIVVALKKKEMGMLDREQQGELLDGWLDVMQVFVDKHESGELLFESEQEESSEPEPEEDSSA